MKEFPGQAPIVPTVARCVIVCFVFLRTMPASAAPPEAYGKIKLLRDTWGVPHVFSETDAGAMYGLGYACAEERGFQMHYALRIIQGRLAEVVGARPSVARPRETAVDNDRKMRTFGFNRAAQEVAANLDSDTLELLTAYSAGVSDYVAAYRENMHPLFKVTGLQPEPWTPADCIASWWHLGQFFAGDGTCELLHYRNITSGAVEARRGGRGQAPTPSALWADDEAAVVGREDVSDEWVAKLGAFAREHGAKPAGPSGTGEGPKFSHAWVVGGKKTTTGAAVLVSDPQTPVRNPSLWHEFYVCGKTFNARGVGVPGSPGFLIGWNDRVAWGATALGADQADLFRLKTDAEHPDQYFFDGRWRDMDVRREVVKVRGGAPVELPVRRTHFGPVVTASRLRRRATRRWRCGGCPCVARTARRSKRFSRWCAPRVRVSSTPRWKSGTFRRRTSCSATTTETSATAWRRRCRYGRRRTSTAAPPGHAERAAHPDRTGTVKLWESGQLHPAPLSRAAVERIATTCRALHGGK